MYSGETVFRVANSDSSLSIGQVAKYSGTNCKHREGTHISQK